MDRISKSSLATYLSCNRKYYYSLVGFEVIPNKYMQYGTEFHEIIENYNKNLMLNKENKEVKSLKYKNNLISYIDFLNSLEQKGYEKIPYRCEMPVKYEQYFGFIDVIFTNKKTDKFLIVDFKTIPNFTLFDEDKYKQELIFYAYTFSKMNNIDIKNIETILLRFEQNGDKFDENVVKFTEDDINSTFIMVDEMKNKLNTSTGSIDDFKMIDLSKSSYTCKYCDYFNICNINK